MLLPTTRSDAPRRIRVPDTTTAVAPGVRVLPATTITLEFAVKIWLLNVKVLGNWGDVGRG